MNISNYDELGVSVFKLEGRVDSDGVNILTDSLRGAIADGKHNMILEMSGVDYINSSGLRILAEVLTTNREHGGDLCLVGLDSKVQRIFELIGFSKFFNIYGTVLEAMEKF